MSADTRLKLGVALLIVGLIMPAGTLLVAATDWPLAAKTVVSSILLLGFEIMLIPAVALMGKDNFDRIWAGAIRLLKTLKPTRRQQKAIHDRSLYVGGRHTLCVDCELRSVLAPGGLCPAGLGQSGARRDYLGELVRVRRRLLGQGAGAVSSRRARRLLFLSVVVVGPSGLRRVLPRSRRAAIPPARAD
jgi:hypothetical protein